MSFMPYKYCANRHRKSYRWRSCCSVKNITTSNPTNFVLKQKLYLYTTLERAISILSSNKLFMGKLAGMNDINESYRPLSSYFENGDSSNTDSQKKLEAAESQLKRIHQTSLSMDDETPGFAIPAMWGHYADKGEGICIVFDKELFLNKLKRTGGFHFKPVTYETNFNPCITIREDPERFFQQHMEDIFFKKTTTGSMNRSSASYVEAIILHMSISQAASLHLSCAMPKAKIGKMLALDLKHTTNCIFCSRIIPYSNGRQVFAAAICLTKMGINGIPRPILP